MLGSNTSYSWPANLIFHLYAVRMQGYLPPAHHYAETIPQIVIDIRCALGHSIAGC